MFKNTFRLAALCLLFYVSTLYSQGGQPEIILKGKIKLDLVAHGLVSPLGLVDPKDGSGRLFIFDQAGTVRILNSDGTLASQPFLDLTSKLVPLFPGYDERGLLGFAFHPDYANNGRFFVYYSSPATDTAYDHTNNVSEFHVSSDSNVADINSEKILLTWQHPQLNHNGGTLEFGPDGFLYISIGDGGDANDTAFGHVDDWYAANPGGNGQDITHNLLGNILRIDVNSGNPYSIPPDNPFVNKEGLDEIFAYGFRNPYRFSFDMGGNNGLYVGDAGQNLYEEVDLVTSGGNYGWNVKEGTHCFNALDNEAEPDSCPDADPDGNLLLDPIIEFNNAAHPDGGLGNTVIGGNVYRGDAIQELYENYIFGVFTRNGESMDGRVFAAPIPTNKIHSELWTFYELDLTNGCGLGQYIKGFGQDRQGEIYLATSLKLGPSGNTGMIYKIVPSKHDENTTGVEQDVNLPKELTLYSAFPNPFNPATVIRYALPSNSFVNLKVFDIMGKEITTLVNDNQEAGFHQVRFKADNLATGTYIYKLETGSKILTGKMLLMK